MTAIRIAASALAAMIEHARRDAPRECCGLLVGDGAIIDEAVATRNVREGTTRYQIDPAEHFALIRRLRGTSRAIVGAYHSHPSSAPVPSPTDASEAHAVDWVHVILSLRDAARPEVGVYWIRDGCAEALECDVVG